MVTVPMPTVPTAVKVFGRLVDRARDDPAVTLSADPSGVRLRCASGGVAVSYAGPTSKSHTELTVRLSVLSAVAAPGRHNVTFAPHGRNKVTVG